MFHYLQSYELTSYVKDILRDFYDDYKNGELFAKKSFLNGDKAKSECFIDNNSELFKHRAQKLIDKLEMVI